MTCIPLVCFPISFPSLRPGSIHRHIAAQAGWLEGVQLLLQSSASILARTNYGDSALLWAAYKGHVDVVQALLASGADVNAMGDRGNRPLHLAAAADHVEVCAGSRSELSRLVLSLANPGDQIVQLLQPCWGLSLNVA